MFDYRVSKHPHFDEACRAFALRHNMAKLAERARMNVQTLRNKLNPEQPHQLLRRKSGCLPILLRTPRWLTVFWLRFTACHACR